MNLIKTFLSGLFTRKRQLISKKLMEFPVVVIVGSTGTGKSKLAVELAQKFNGEIISADSMQVYRGLDLVTNKVTPEELALVPHHLIGFLDPMKRFTAVDFRNRALKVIDDLSTKKKLPVIVGGTNYYIESILWDYLITGEEIEDLIYDNDHLLCSNISCLEENDINKETIFKNPILYKSFENVSSQKLHQILEEVDPKYSIQIHQNDKRKIVRALQVYQKYGKKISEFLDEQHAQNDDDCKLGGPLRFVRACILWLQCNDQVLDERLDKRVDQMIERGLVKELLDFHQNYNKSRLKDNLDPDYSQGIFQTIGFKEFHNYLVLEEEKRNEASELLQKSINALKLVTKKYARRQTKWIRNRFLRIKNRQVPNIFALNVTQLDQWNNEVLEPAVNIVNHYLYSEPLADNLKPVEKLDPLENEPGKFFCNSCQLTIFSTYIWRQHLKSRRHKKSEETLRKEHKQLTLILDRHELNMKSDLNKRNSI